MELGFGMMSSGDRKLEGHHPRDLVKKDTFKSMVKSLAKKLLKGKDNGCIFRLAHWFEGSCQTGPLGFRHIRQGLAC